MPIWHQSPKLTPRYFLETPRLFGYPKNSGIRVSETKKFILPKKTTLPYNMFVDRTVHKTRTPIKFEDEK